MRTVVLTTVLVAIGLATTSGCTSRAWYGSLQTMQRNQCLDQPDSSLRERCLAAAEPTYEEYARQR